MHYSTPTYFHLSPFNIFLTPSHFLSHSIQPPKCSRNVTYQLAWCLNITSLKLIHFSTCHSHFNLNSLLSHRSRSKFRTKRRASIAPLPAIRLNDKEIMANSEYDTQSVISGRSVTSVSSLASLLKEKVQVELKIELIQIYGTNYKTFIILSQFQP